MTVSYFAYGTTLANLVNVETAANVAPTVLPGFGGMPMPLQGGTARRVLSKRLRRDGYAQGRWRFNVFPNDYTDFSALLIALMGDLTTSSRELYVSTIDSTNHYSPFLCYVDAPYMGESVSTFNEQPFNADFALVGGVLQSVTKTTNYTTTTSDRLIYVNTASGSATMTLFAVSTATLNTVYSFIKTSASNSLILDGNSSETIDGSTTKTVTALYARVDIVTTNNTSWITV